MRHLLKSLTVILGCLFVFGVQVALGETYVRLGSFNLEHFGNRDHGQHPKAVAQHLQLAAVDVLCLQEIYDTDEDPDRRTNQKLDETILLLNEQSDQDWTYLLFPRRDSSETRQLAGVAWNRKKVTLEGHYKVQVDYATDSTWRRTPYAVKFSAGPDKTDIVVVSLHMKSNFGGAEQGIRTRAQEARALVAQLDAIRNHFAGTSLEKDLVLAGDTNCLKASEEALKIYREAGFTDLNAKDAITYAKGRYQSPFDRFLVPKDETEFRFCRQYVLAPADPQSHVGRLSDHFLIMTAIKVTEDDD